MGMTIDKAIEHGKDQLQIFGGEHKEFIELSIDTMRKFKKIQEIVNSNVFHLVSDNTIDGEHEGYVRYMKIYELLKICDVFSECDNQRSENVPKSN